MDEGRILSRILIGIGLLFFCRELSAAEDTAWNFHGGVLGPAPVRVVAPVVTPAPSPTEAWNFNINGKAPVPIPSASVAPSPAKSAAPVVVKATTVDEDEDPLYKNNPWMKKERELGKLLDFKTLFYQGMLEYPAEMGKYGEKKREDSKKFADDCYEKGFAIAKKLIDEKLIVAGHPKTIRVSNKWETTYDGGVQLDCNQPYEKVRDAFKDPTKVPTKDMVAKDLKEVSDKMTSIQLKTGIRVWNSQAPAKADLMRVLSDLETILQKPEILKKAILTVNLYNQADMKAGYTHDSQSLQINANMTGADIEKFILENVKDKADQVAPELTKLAASTTNEAVRKMLNEIIENGKNQSTDGLRDVAKKSAEVQQRFGWEVYFSGRVGDKPFAPAEQKQVLDRILAIPKDRIKGDPYIRAMTFDTRDPGHIAANGSLHIDNNTTTEQMIEWINRSPDRKKFEADKEGWYRELKEISSHFSKNGKSVTFTPDFEQTNGIDDFPKAIALFRQMQQKGYCLNPALKVVYFTGTRVQGWAGARNWDAKAIVVRADAKEEHLLGTMDAEGKTVALPDPAKVYFSRSYCQ